MRARLLIVMPMMMLLALARVLVLITLLRFAQRGLRRHGHCYDLPTFRYFD